MKKIIKLLRKRVIRFFHSLNHTEEEANQRLIAKETLRRRQEKLKEHPEALRLTGLGRSSVNAVRHNSSIDVVGSKNFISYQ